MSETTPLKLHVWQGPAVMRQYRGGVCVALAASVAEAREMVTAKLMADEVAYWTDWPGKSLPMEEYDVEQRAWLEREPEVYDTPVVVYQVGSE